VEPLIDNRLSHRAPGQNAGVRHTAGARVGFLSDSDAIDANDGSFERFHAIPRVEITVARAPAALGRAEAFNSSLWLMRRLGEIGQRGLVVRSLTEGGAPWPERSVDALNHYLRAGRGLRYFKRICATRWSTKYAWAELRHLIGAPQIFPT
jgi:hypothetical protein